MKFFTAVCVILLLTISTLTAQQRLVTDFSTTMHIPEIVNMKASATHLYVLSEAEGLVVFRTNTDTLQWILTSEGMTTRGTRLQADVRFAYLFGAGTRLTVLEPTSLLGVYSSTFLPAEPRSVARSGTNLYIAMEGLGIGRLPLNTPAGFDTDPEFIDTEESVILDLLRLPAQMVALGDNRELLFWNIAGDELLRADDIILDRDASRLHLLHNSIHVSDERGAIFEVRSNGQTVPFAQVGGPIDGIEPWGDVHIIRTMSGNLYAVHRDGTVDTLRTDTVAGNFFAVAQRNLWVSNYNEIAINRLAGAQSRQQSGSFSIRSIENMVIPFPRPVLFPLHVSGANPGDIRFQLRSDVENAQIRGNGFFWQPGSNQIGVNRFVVTATNAAGVTDSTSFTIDVRAFNAPPRFNPIRPMSIVVGELFQLPIRAVDPDGIDRDLIRYHGVDLPDGAIISERTGMFTWTPDRRQVGNHQFQVIATDQFGAATSQQVSITVRNVQTDIDESSGFND